MIWIEGALSGDCFILLRGISVAEAKARPWEFEGLT